MAQNLHVWVDVETSGLAPSAGAVILAIGAVAELKGKANAGKMVEFYTLVKPTEAQWRSAAPQALQVNGLTWQLLSSKGVSLETATYDFAGWLFKNKVGLASHMLVGQNPAFDVRFLKHYMEADLRFVGFPFDDVIDNRDLYSILVNRRVMPWLKNEKGGRTSENISKALGVEPERFPHDALEGAKAAMRNYLKMVELGVTV